MSSELICLSHKEFESPDMKDSSTLIIHTFLTWKITLIQDKAEKMEISKVSIHSQSIHLKVDQFADGMTFQDILKEVDFLLYTDFLALMEENW